MEDGEIWVGGKGEGRRQVRGGVESKIGEQGEVRGMSSVREGKCRVVWGDMDKGGGFGEDVCERKCSSRLCSSRRRREGKSRRLGVVYRRESRGKKPLGKKKTDLLSFSWEAGGGGDKRSLVHASFPCAEGRGWVPKGRKAVIVRCCDRRREKGVLRTTITSHAAERGIEDLQEKRSLELFHTEKKGGGHPRRAGLQHAECGRTG